MLNNNLFFFWKHNVPKDDIGYLQFFFVGGGRERGVLRRIEIIDCMFAKSKRERIKGKPHHALHNYFLLS